MLTRRSRRNDMMSSHVDNQCSVERQLELRMPMFSRKVLSLAALVLAAISKPADAQQNIPRPIVLYRSVNSMSQPLQSSPNASAQPFNAASTNSTYPSTGKPLTNWGPRPATIVSGSTENRQKNRPGQPFDTLSQASPQNGPPQSGPPGSQPGDQSESKPKTPEQEWAEQQSRPTNQMLQNPSGASNLTHTGITSSQQMAPNLYLGQQFQNWSNQQPVSQMSGAFGEMSRMQQGAFGGYVAPNTYVGPGYSSWNNLSQGGLTPGTNGSWNLSVWP